MFNLSFGPLTPTLSITCPYYDVAEFAVASGPCTVAGGCFRSPNYPNTYGNSQTCTINVLQNLTLAVVDFSTESQYDELNVNGIDYSGGIDSGGIDYSGFFNVLDGVTVRAGTVITWVSDGSVVDNGFEICTTTGV